MRKIFIVFCFLSSMAILHADEYHVRFQREGTNVNLLIPNDVGEQTLEFAPALNQSWKPVVSMNADASGSAFSWPAPLASGSGFFRTSLKVNPDREAHNFRLIDQNGKSRELYYHALDTNLVAVVLTFADSDYSSFASKIAALKTNSLYKDRVLFWTVDADPGNSRVNILRAATALGIDWPIFHDPLQLVAREYDARFNGEAFCISLASVSVAYRGLIDNGTLTTPATRNFVAETLDKILLTQASTISRVEPAKSPLNRVARPIADYSTTIAPLLQRKCVTCHSPGNIGPFAMTEFRILIEQQHNIKHHILNGMMPPWHADPNYGVFENNSSLTDEEKTQLVDWINAGIPRGSGPDPLTNVPPEPSKWPAELGPPDEIVTIPTQSVRAVGTEAYRYIYANATNSTPRWLKAAVVRPSNRSVVHHYIVWQGHSSTAKFTGVAIYVPGHNDRPFPEGTGVQIPANAPLTFNLHYTANGEATTDKPELALWYSDTPPARTLKLAAASTLFLFIPAGAPEYEPVPASYTFSKASTVYSFSPHMHVRGLRMKFELKLPGQTQKQTLLSVPKYDFDWQTIYVLEQPLEVPAGAVIEVSGAFDNSPMNIFNPDSSKMVTWGEQSWEEMFIGYIEYAEH